MWQHLWKSCQGVGGGERCEIVQICGRARFQWCRHVFLRERERDDGGSGVDEGEGWGGEEVETS